MVRAAVLVLAVLTGAGAANALEFSYAFSFQTGPFGPDRAAPGEGTPRGVTVGAGGNVLIADSLDDQIYEADPSGTLQRNLQTNPYCELSGPPTCVPGVPEHSAAFANAVAYQPSSGHIWLIEDPNSGPTLLQELDGDGVFLAEHDISASLGSGSGLAFDPRNGDILIASISAGGDEIYRFDETDPGGFWTAVYNIHDTLAATGLAVFDADTFLVLDGSQRTLHEYQIPAGAGTATLLGTSVITGFDLGPTEPLGVSYDPVLERLYVTDNNIGDSIHVFDLVPEPGTAALLAGGLFGLALRRGRAPARSRILP